MPYRFLQSDKSVESALRRIAGEQVDLAVATIDRKPGDADVAVHEVRKACKKVRGLLRLVRSAFDDYADENAAFREIAGAVSGMRDADVLIATYDDLVVRHEDAVERRALAAIRRGLTIRRKALVRDGADLQAGLSSCQARLLEAAVRCRDWTLRDDGFGVIEGGLRRTYRRARKAMTRARETDSPEHFHEWRKHCKYHWYHARLLRPIWPGPMKAYAACAHQLGEVLGEHHDLVVFLSAISGQPRGLGKPAALEMIAILVRDRQATLAGRAFDLGARLFADAPSALAASWGIRYQMWHGTGRNDA